MNKWAVVRIQGKQYLITENQTIQADKIVGKKGDKIKISEVLLLVEGEKIKIGQPTLKRVTIDAEIDQQFKTKKIIVAKFKAKSRYRRLRGHRQEMTLLKINKITGQEA